MNNKQVVLIVRNAASGDFGGAEVYPISLSRVLVENSLSPIIITRSKQLLAAAREADITAIKGWWWSQQNWSGKKILVLPVYIAWQIVLTGWYINLLLKTKANAIHIQSKDDFIAATIAGRIMRKKVVWTDHMDLRYIFENISRPLRNPLGKIIFWVGHLANHIILISENEYKLVTSKFSNPLSLKKQIILINNGVIDKIDKYREITISLDDNHVFSYCLASRIVTSKGIGEAIKAFEMLQKRVHEKNIRLDIYGDGAELQQFKDLAKDNPSIRFYGHQTDVLGKIARSSVFILPSYREGFSIALLESTMLGKAIIASDVDSNTEIIHHQKNGLVVPPRNPSKLSDAMQLLLVDNKLRRRLETNARKSFKRNYELSALVKNEILPLYEK